PLVRGVPRGQGRQPQAALTGINLRLGSDAGDLLRRTRVAGVSIEGVHARKAISVEFGMVTKRRPARRSGAGSMRLGATAAASPEIKRRLSTAGCRNKRVARLSRNIGQPDHILSNPIISHKAERRPGPGEVWLAVTKHDGVQVDSILIDQAKFGQALRQVRASNFDLPVVLGLQLADRALEIILNKPGVGADRL